MVAISTVSRSLFSFDLVKGQHGKRQCLPRGCEAWSNLRAITAKGFLEKFMMSQKVVHTRPSCFCYFHRAITVVLSIEEYYSEAWPVMGAWSQTENYFDNELFVRCHFCMHVQVDLDYIP